MSVLPLEPYCYPDGLFETRDQLTADGEIWWVLQTRPRAEKSLARRLLRDRLTFFLPLHEKRRRRQRRSIVSYLPVFPGYLFLRGTDESRVRALMTNMVTNSLTVTEQDQLVDDLVRIEGLMKSGLPLLPEDQLCPGTSAEIVSGPLAGMRGKVVRTDKGFKLVIEVDFLQRGASVEVDPSIVHPV